jgi:hypothetical protein
MMSMDVAPEIPSPTVGHTRHQSQPSMAGSMDMSGVNEDFIRNELKRAEEDDAKQQSGNLRNTICTSL